MTDKVLWQGLVIAVLGLLAGVALVACAPATGEPSALGPESVTADDSAALSTVTPKSLAVTGSEEVISDTLAAEGVIVDSTPVAGSEGAPGQTEPGAGGLEIGHTDPGVAETPVVPADWLMYTSDELGFTVLYPSDFVVAQPDTGLLARLSPTPASAVYFVLPAMAESALAGTDAPDLEVRVYESGPVTSLTDWLAVIGVVAPGNGQTVSPYQAGTISGLEVCESTMVVPGCSVFVAGADRVYQLRVLTLEGETMAASFSLVTP